MRKFAVVSRFEEDEIELPARKTAQSAGYDFEVAEDIIIPSFWNHYETLKNNYFGLLPVQLNEVAIMTKNLKAKPTLVPTGVKCYLNEGEYLELSVRSSCPLKHWLVLANGVGIIDADYADNVDNEGEIYFQFINLAPFDIQLCKGDTIGQGIIKKYYITDNDEASGLRNGGFGSTDIAEQNILPKTKAGLYDEGIDLSLEQLYAIPTLSQCSHAEGASNTAYGQYSHAEGSQPNLTFTDAMDALSNAWSALNQQVGYSAEEVGSALQTLCKRLAGENNG